MTETKTDTQQQQMLRGTAWMTASNIISRLLGALYIIPWYAWMGKQGDQANALLRTSRTCSIVIIIPILALMFLFYKSEPKVYN